MATTTLDTIDIVVIAVYIFFVVTVGIWAPLLEFIKSKILKRPAAITNNEQQRTETEAYFLASRNVGWFAIGASLFCSNIGSEHFIGLAGSGAVTGITVAYYELSGGMILLLLGFVFSPVYSKANIFTTPEFIEKRFSKHIKNYLVFLSLLVYIFTKVSVTIFAACIVFETVLGWNMYVSAAIILAATALYTILGGFRAVIYTEVVQTIVLLFGACCLMILTFWRVGGLPNFVQQHPDKFHFLRPLTDAQYPWPGLLIGVNVASIQYWCTDQLLVQRVLCAKTQKQAELGTIFAGYLKMAPMYMLVIPGIMAGVLFPDIVKQDSNKAFTTLVVQVMPPVLRGLLLSAMLSAAMSTLSSVFNSASTVITMDVYSKWRTSASQRELVLVGKVTGSILMVVSVLWIPVMQRMNDQLFIYIQSVASYTSPPIAAIFLCGICFQRATSIAALVTCITGFILGTTRFLMEIIYKGYDANNYLVYFFAKLNFLYFGLFLFSYSMCCMLLVSLCTTPLPVEQVKQYTIDWQEFLTNFKYSIMFWKTKPQQQQQVEQQTELKEKPDEEQGSNNVQPENTETVEEASAPVAVPLVIPDSNVAQAKPNMSICNKIGAAVERMSLYLALVLLLLITVQTLIFV